MADKKNIDSTQPQSEATPETENLTIVTPGEERDIRKEPRDRDDPPVADLARELPPEIKDAVRREGDWAGDPGRHDGDDTQEVSGALSDLENDRDAEE
ncbi:hypothetical protein [Thalassorhabdomicrobium marinisediminis]|uniref:hypothetical protein n=1 Tax=Thalassorhabdomicrobium marinisediminis TaxID=2170577 RepID=UPI00249284BF|nr:hypothetical protein [Thalassorhabdomicrobium marinisediminis]